MKSLLILLTLVSSLTAAAERVGIDGAQIFREHKFRGLETKCTTDSDTGCEGIQVLFNGTPITREITEADFYLDTDDYGQTLDLELAPTVSCKGGDQLKSPQRSHVNIRYCANRKTPILIGKTFLFLQHPGQTAVEFQPGKREEFKRDLARIEQTYTYVRAIMFRERELINSDQAAKKLADYLQLHYNL